MDTSSVKQLLYLTHSEYEGIGTWYEYIVKYRYFKKLKGIKSVLVAGLPEEYGVSADMLMFAKFAKLTVIDNRKEKLNLFKKISEDFGVKDNVKTIFCKDLTKYPFNDNTFDLVSNTEVIQRVDHYKKMISEMERVSKKYVMIFVPNAYYYSHYLITKIKIYKMKDIIKNCTLPIIKKAYADRPPWPAGVAVSSNSISFTKGSKAKEREIEKQKGVKDSFSISIVKKVFTFFTPSLAVLERFYPSPLKEFLSHMFFILMEKNNF